MKILLVCPHFRNIEYGVAESFRRLGDEIYTMYFNMGMDNWHYLQRIKNKIGLNIDAFLLDEKKRFNAKLLKLYYKVQPDIVYIIQGRWVSESTLKEINKKSYSALYLWDMVGLFPEMLPTFSLYNMIYSFDMKDVELLTEKGYHAKFKPASYDDAVYYPMECDKKYDVAFVGAMYAERVEMLKKLIVAFPSIHWAIYGEYAPIRKPLLWLKWLLSSEHKYFINKNINKNEVNSVYNKAKIVLSIVRDNQGNGWSARLPEILGAEAFQLTNYYPSVAAEFSGCLSMYNSMDELVSKIDYYLGKDDEREEIARKGYEKVKKTLSDDVINQIIIDHYTYWKKANSI